MQPFQQKLEKLKPHWLPLTLLVTIALGIYAPSLRHDFLSNWDDSLYITANETVRGITADHLKTAFSRFFVGNYAPLHIISYMLDYELWGMKAAGFILTNILLHLGNGLLLYRLLISATFSRLTSFTAAVIFLSHPVQVESVAWLSQRKNLLALFLFLSALSLYRSYALAPSPAKNRYMPYLLSLLAFSGALLTKSAAVILPALLLLHDFCYLPAHAARKRLADKLPFVLLAMACAGITILAQQADVNNMQGGGAVPYHGGSPFSTLLTMMPVVLLYLKLLFVPTSLSEVYTVQIRQSLDGSVMSGAVVLVVILAGGVLLYRRRKELAFWYWLAIICILPVAQIVPLITLINDRYLYFPMLGIATLAAYVVTTAPAVLLRSARSSMAQPVTAALVVLLIAPLPWLSLKRAEVWQNAVTLWNDTVQRSPSLDVRFAQADAYHGSGDLQSAAALYRQILIQDPGHRKTLRNLAMLYMTEKNFPAARPLLETLTQRYPDYIFGFIALGNACYMSGDLAAAEHSYRTALRLNPEQPEVFQLLGTILLAQRSLGEAALYLKKALQSTPGNPDLFYSLACLYSLENDIPEALRNLESALRLGYRNSRSLLTNRELNNIRNSPGFSQLLNSYHFTTQMP